MTLTSQGVFWSAPRLTNEGDLLNSLKSIELGSGGVNRLQLQCSSIKRLKKTTCKCCSKAVVCLHTSNCTLSGAYLKGRSLVHRQFLLWVELCIPAGIHHKRGQMYELAFVVNFNLSQDILTKNLGKSFSRPNGVLLPMVFRRIEFVV